jgi:hypothetical protein
MSSLKEASKEPRPNEEKNNNNNNNNQDFQSLSVQTGEKRNEKEE